MDCYGFSTITDNTLKGPWHVGYKSNQSDNMWYIINVETGKSKKIGPVKSTGSNNCDKARALAKLRNKFRVNKENIMEKNVRIIIEAQYEIKNNKDIKLLLENVVRDTITRLSYESPTIKPLNVSVEQEDPTETILIKWGTEDVIDRAKERGIRVGKKKAREILANVKRRHDCNEGINWDVIDAHTDN